MAEELPSILTTDGLLPEKGEEDAPPVSQVLVDHLRTAFPLGLPDALLSKDETFREVSLRQGYAAVVDYLAALANPQGTLHELSRAEAQDQPARSRAPGPRRRG